jgi:hypothetical protein
MVHKKSRRGDPRRPHVPQGLLVCDFGFVMGVVASAAIEPPLELAIVSTQIGGPNLLLSMGRWGGHRFVPLHFCERCTRHAESHHPDGEHRSGEQWSQSAHNRSSGLYFKRPRSSTMATLRQVVREHEFEIYTKLNSGSSQY